MTPIQGAPDIALTPGRTARSRRTVWSLFAAMAVLSQGYGVMFTLIARFRDDYGIAESLLGLVVAAGFFTSFLAQLLIAPLADRGHGRALLMGGVLANAAGLAMMGTSQSFAGLFAGRVVMGFGIGAAYPAIRRAVAIAEPLRMGENSGRMLSADVLGFLLGPFIAFLVVDRYGIGAPFFIGVALGLLVLSFVWRVDMGDQAADAPSERFAVDLLRHRWMQAAVAYGVAFFAMIGAFDALWAVRVTDLLHGNEHQAGPYIQLGIIIFGLPLVLLGGIGGRLAERYGPFRASSVSLGLGVCFVALYGLLPHPSLLVVLGFVQATIDSFGAPGLPMAVTAHAPTTRLAGAQGLVGAVQTLTGGVTATVAGVLYQRWGPVATYAAAAGAMATCVAWGYARSAPFRQRERVDKQLDG